MTQVPRQLTGPRMPPPPAHGPRRGNVRVVSHPDQDAHGGGNALPRERSPEAEQQAAELRANLMMPGAAEALTTLPPDEREGVEAALDARMQQVTVADRVFAEVARSRASTAMSPLPAGYSSSYDPLALDAEVFRTVSDTRDAGMDNWGASFPRPLQPAPADRGWYEK